LNRIERQQEQAILDQLKDASLSEKYRGRLRADLETLHESVKARKNAKANGKPPDEIPPQEKDFETAEEWSRATELFRLGVLEKACNRKLDSAKTSFSGLQKAGKELKRIAKRRAELSPPPETADPTVNEEERQNARLAKLWDPKKSTEDLMNSRNMAACFWGPHSAACKGVEVELESRGCDWKFWCLSKNGSSVMHMYPNRAAAERLLTEVSRNRPEPVTNTSPSPRPDPPPTPAQKESREHWVNQYGNWEDKKSPALLAAVEPSRDTAYQLSDGFIFWADGTRAEEPLPQGTRVFPISAPPSYVRGSGDVSGWQINVIVGCWVPSAGSQRA
jgi:hypothetical protein